MPNFYEKKHLDGENPSHSMDRLVSMLGRCACQQVQHNLEPCCPYLSFPKARAVNIDMLSGLPINSRLSSGPELAHLSFGYFVFLLPLKSSNDQNQSHYFRTIFLTSNCQD